MKKETKTLQLMLRKKWWDMIASGEKKEEYRDLKPYWLKRVCKTVGCRKDCGACQKASYSNFSTKEFEEVCFHLGYTRKTMTFKIDGIVIGKGRSEWGAEGGKEYLTIKLGERV